MADGVLDSLLFYLLDGWPGVVDPNMGMPIDGFTGALHHNVVAAQYPVGTKIAVYNTGTKPGITSEPGWATFIYLKVGTQDTTAIAAKTIVVQDSATNWYEVTNDPDDCVNVETGAAAIALSAITDAYYGWFWCAGVCPEEFVSDLGGTYLTVDGCAAGPITADARTGVIGLGLPVDTDTALVEPIFGYALAADT